MTFHEQRGEELKNRVRYVAHYLQRMHQALQADIQAGSMIEQDAELLTERVMAFRTLLIKALKIVTRCQGSKLNRFLNAKPLKEDIIEVNGQINDFIHDLQLSSLSSRSPSFQSNRFGALELMEPPSPGGGSDDGSSDASGLSADEIEDLKGDVTKQLQLLGLFTDKEIMAFAQYVQDVVRGLSVPYLQDRITAGMPLEMIRSTGPVFHRATVPPQISPHHRSAVTALAVRIDTGDILSGHRNGAVCLWVRGVCAAVFGALSAIPVTSLLVMPDGTLVVGNGRGGLRARSTEPPYDELPSPTYEQPGAITALAATDGGILFSGDSTGGLVVWGPGFSAPRPYWRAHAGAVTALCITPRDATGHFFVLSGGGDGQIRAWAYPECASPPWEAQFNVQSGGGSVRTLALSADGRALYSVRGKGAAVVARWAVPGAEKKCALEISKLDGGPVAVTERGLLLGAANGGCHVAAWHVGELTPENVQFLKQSADPRRPIPCGGAGLLLGDGIYGRGRGILGPLDEIMVMKVVEIGAPGNEALLVTGHQDGGVRISNVVTW